MMGEMTARIEMRPEAWEYSLTAAEKALEENRGMHPFEKEVHDLTDKDCEQAVKRIREIVEANDQTAQLTDTELTVLWQGVTDLYFEERDKTPEHWNPATRWQNAEMPPEHRVVRNTLANL